MQTSRLAWWGQRCLATLAAMLAVAAAAEGTGSPRHDWTAGGIRVEYDNDLLVNSDDKFTNGVSVQWHSDIAAQWDDLSVAPWMRFGRHLPGLESDGLHRRIGLAVGQNMQTPNDLSATALIKDDVPYAGALGVEINWSAFDDRQFRGYGLVLGVVGPASGAKRTQKWVHRIISTDAPNGWHNQIPNEPALNFHGMFKRKVLNSPREYRFAADVAINADFALGTGMTFGEVAAEIRMGWNLPQGFAFVPDPIGRSIAYDATVPITGDRSLSVYFSLVQRQSYIAHFVFLDGSLWRNTHSVSYDRWQNQTIIGFHVTQRRWGLHVSLWDGSTGIQTSTADVDNNFGTVAFEWRF